MNPMKLILTFAVAVGLLFLSGAVFIVQQTQSALIFQFGEIVRKPITTPGLYFKIPLIQNVEILDNRILDIDHSEQTILTLDRQNLSVDAFARYKIIDPLKFYQNVKTDLGAKATLSSFVNASVRNTLAGASFSSIVKTDRDALMAKILEEVNKQAKPLGVEVVDVRLVKVNMPQANSASVFERMKSERKQEAAELRATGEQFATTIRAKADRDATQILAEANRKAQEARGIGEAQRTNILNQVFTKDPEFFSFVQSLNAYETALKGENSKLVLSPSSAFFKYLNDSKAKK